MRQFAMMLILVTIPIAALAQQKRVEMGWTGEDGYLERQTPSVDRKFSFFVSNERRQEFLLAETDNCADASVCKGLRVKISQQQLDAPFNKRILQIVYMFASNSQTGPVAQSRAYWKSIVIETRPGMFRELLVLKNDGGFWNGPPSMAEILNAGTTKLLITNDNTTSRDIWCTGEFWVLDESGAALADFSEITAAIDKAVPKGSQDITPMCAAVNPQALQARVDVQKVSAECAACGFEGHVLVKFKFEGQRAVPVSTSFSKIAP